MRYALLLALLTISLTAAAQNRLPLSDEAYISLLTISEGDQIHSYWGHNALRVVDPVRGFDRTFNYGTFQFDEYFVPNFLYGKLDYYLSVPPTDRALEHYRHYEKRNVIERVLNLNAEQKEALFDFLLVNARDENKYYRYNFLYDNCATRIRDVLETTLGDAVQFADTPDPQVSFRTLYSDPVRHIPFLDLGINLILGQPTDLIASPREVVFLPAYLDSAFVEATVDTGTVRIPLIAHTDTLIALPETSQTSLPWAHLLFWSLFGMFSLLTLRAYQKGKTYIAFADGFLFFVVGIAGVLIVGLWFFTLHDVTTDNWNALWAWPSHLIVAFFIWRKASAAWLGYYLLASAAFCIITLLGWLVWPQDLHSAIIPLLLTLALRGGWVGLHLTNLGGFFHSKRTVPSVSTATS